MIRSTVSLVLAPLAFLLAQPAPAASPERPAPPSHEGGLVPGAARPALRANGAPDRSWLLSPGTYRRLSGGGQRVARALNGLAPAPPASVPPAARPAPAPEAFSSGPPLPRQNVRVNDPTQDEVGHTNSESSIAVRGPRIVVGFNDASSSYSGYAFSTDAGASFIHRRIPDPGDGFTAGDPVVAFGPNGEVYYSTLTVVAGGQVSSIGVSKSTDGGATFGAPVNAAASVADYNQVQDKPWLAVDAGTSKFKGNVYLSWTYFAQTGETFILFSRSTDGGATWSSPGALTPVDKVGVQNSTIAVAPNGDVYVAWEDGHLSPDGIFVRRSTDGGATFAKAVAVATFPPLSLLTGGGGVRATSYPTLAADGTGGVHVAWAAPAASSTADRSDVWYARSSDSGATFSAPVKVNDDATDTSQAFPAIAASPDGTVALRWTDRRNDPANDALTDVYAALSRDGGRTWGPNVRVTDTSWVYGPVDRAYSTGYHGDYDGLAYDAGTFYVSWSDERGSDPDVYFAPFPASLDPGAPDFGVSSLSTWLPVRAGASASVDLRTFAVNGFAGELSLSVAPAVEGISASFDTGTVAAGGTARLTVGVSPRTAPGDYHLTVTARAADGTSRSTTVWLGVVDPGRAIPLSVNLTSTRGLTGSAGVKADAAGRLHLVYEDDSAAVLGNEVFYRRSTDGGVTFSAPLRLTAAGATGTDTVVAADSAGRVVAAWTGRATGDTTDRLFVARSTDGGATFSPAVAASPTDQSAFFPAVAIDKSGNVLVVYLDGAPGVPNIESVRSTDGGATFDAPQTLNEQTTGGITRPSVVFDSKGVAYLAYTQQASYVGGIASAIGFAVARDGRKFADPVSLTNPSTINAFAPDLAIGPDDSLWIALYYRYVNADLTYDREVVVSRSTDGGATFQPTIDVSVNDGQSYFPSVGVGPDGAATVVWEDDTGNAQTDVFAVRSTDGGATWTAPVNLSADLGLCGSAANPVEGVGGSGRSGVSVAPDGRLLFSWLDDSPANPDVLFAAVTPAALANQPPTASITAPAAGASVEAGVAIPFAGTGTDPEGGTVTLTWDFGDGTTGTGASPAPHAYARPGTYTATLTAADPLGASASTAVAVTVTAPTLTGTSLLLPVVLDTAGVGGSHYTSEVTLASRAASPTDVLLAYTASRGSGSGFARLTLAPGEQRIVPHVLDWLRGQGLAIPSDGTPQVGTLLVTFGGVTSGAFAGARTYTADPAGGAGTFGLFYAAAGTTEGEATLVGLQQNESQRSNVAVVNAGADPVVLRIALQGPAGEDLGILPDVSLPAWGWAQVDQPLAGKASSGRAVVTRVSGTSPFTAYAVLNDAVTSDGSFVPPLLGGDPTGGERLVPVVLDVKGLGARFRTELTLANLTSSPLPLSLVYTAGPGFGSGSGSVALTLAPGEQRIVPDAIGFLRATLPIESDGRDVAGSLLVRPPSGTPASSLAVGARTFVPLSPAGSYGLYYPGLTAGDSADGTVFVHGLQEGAAQRSNLAVVNRGDASDAIVVRVTFFSPAGAALGSPVDLTLAPGAWRQLGRPLDPLGASAGYAKVERISGASRFVAYGVLNDNASSDGSYVPMTR